METLAAVGVGMTGVATVQAEVVVAAALPFSVVEPSIIGELVGVRAGVRGAGVLLTRTVIRGVLLTLRRSGLVRRPISVVITGGSGIARLPVGGSLTRSRTGEVAG